MYDDTQRIEKHGFKGQIVGRLRNCRIRPENIFQKWDDFSVVGVAVVEMLQRDIKGAILGHGERNLRRCAGHGYVRRKN